MTSTVASLVLLIRFFPSAGACLNNGMKLLSDLRAAHDVVSIASTPRRSDFGPARPSGGTVRRIELQDLSYRYEPHKPLIENLSYVFDKGGSYAVCGGSGSGKSTLVDLIVGLIPHAGDGVRINGVALRDLDLQDLRQRIVLVEQQSRVFNDTVRNNIVFGLNASDAQLREAMVLAGFDDVVSSLPNGLETVLDYQGTNLSGGQRQRLGIARALLRNPDVLILDESLSALDAANRNRVLSNILDAFSERIVIAVTHDPVVASRMRNTLTLSSRFERQGESTLSSEEALVSSSS
jgi:ABC-type multidrug transport system fused ATPase/permease subunit